MLTFSVFDIGSSDSCISSITTCANDGFGPSGDLTGESPLEGGIYAKKDGIGGVGDGIGDVDKASSLGLGTTEEIRRDVEVRVGFSNKAQDVIEGMSSGDNDDVASGNVGGSPIAADEVMQGNESNEVSNESEYSATGAAPPYLPDGTPVGVPEFMGVSTMSSLGTISSAIVGPNQRHNTTLTDQSASRDHDGTVRPRVFTLEALIPY
ncbi:hypothetical protein Dimus_024905 [Dionaea muscipula]